MGAARERHGIVNWVLGILFTKHLTSDKIENSEVSLVMQHECGREVLRGFGGAM
jgi:hypothetical protein